MEARKVIIVNNKTQAQTTIMSNATTLGELKAEAESAGVNIDGMTWYEGHMRAELKDDASPLPATVMWRGQETTELTFLLTQPEKKVKSGAMSRAEAYNAIKANNLQEVCKSRYGKNFTQVPTNDLITLIEENQPKETSVCATNETKESCNCIKAIELLVSTLYNNGSIDEEDQSHIISVLNGVEYKASEKMSKAEIDDMFDFVDR